MRNKFLSVLLLAAATLVAGCNREPPVSKIVKEKYPGSFNRSPMIIAEDGTFILTGNYDELWLDATVGEYTQGYWHVGH